jgi:hypothetical protein
MAKTPQVFRAALGFVNIKGIDMRKTCVMLDLETLGKSAGCKLLSIGASAFETKTPAENRTFYIEVNRHQQYDLKEDPSTLAWWNYQSVEAKGNLFTPDNGAHLDDALGQFNMWLCSLDNVPNILIYGNGADFDNAIIQAAFKQTHLTPCWPHWNNRCYRTIKAMYKSVEKLHPVGIAHNAVWDAINQGNHCRRIFDKYELWENVVS